MMGCEGTDWSARLRQQGSIRTDCFNLGGPVARDRHSVGIVVGARVDPQMMSKLERSSRMSTEAQLEFGYCPI
jgi:hypothetical protein